MKSILIILFSLLVSLTLSAQEITGKWYGVLKVQGIQLSLAFNVEKTDTGLVSTMDSPDQNAFGIPVTNTVFDNSKISFEVKNAAILYQGELVGDEVKGVFKQAGQEFPLNLSRKEIEKEILNRPQEPKEPFSYFSEEVNFENSKANISLAGTLTLPKNEGNYPIVILISGSGPQDRNEEILGHKPFLVLADYLTKNGIGVLRYDDRGVGKSTGNYAIATSEDLSTDVESAISYIKSRGDINKSSIGLIGHSEGGLIAPMVAAKTADVNFIVSLAGPGIRGDKLLLLQQELISRASGGTEETIIKSHDLNKKIFDLIIKTKDEESVKEELIPLMTALLQVDPNFASLDENIKKEAITQQILQYTSPWMRYFISYDPAPTLEKVTCPVLALNGAKDMQVPAKENLNAIKSALEKGGNKNVYIKEFAEVNHLFQKCNSGSPAEYATIEETIAPLVLEEITNWITTQRLKSTISASKTKN